MWYTQQEHFIIFSTHIHMHAHRALYLFGFEPMFEAHSQEQVSMGYPLHWTKYSVFDPCVYK